MTKKQIDRIEARGKAVLAKMTALRDSIAAEGREPTDAEARRIESYAREVDDLLAKLRRTNGG